MGQIVGGAAKPKRCNLNKLSQLGTPAAGEHILVSSDNSMNAAGQGNFDCYIVGDGVTAATALELKNVEPLIGVFDISSYHATGGVLAKYADLTAALDGGNNIPQSFRKGGMSVKFVQSSDHKYVQFRYMSSSTAAADFTNVANWQGVDDEPTAGSENLVKSNGVLHEIEKPFSWKNIKEYFGGVGRNGMIDNSTTNMYKLIPIKNGDVLNIHFPTNPVWYAVINKAPTETDKTYTLATGYSRSGSVANQKLSLNISANDAKYLLLQTHVTVNGASVEAYPKLLAINGKVICPGENGYGIIVPAYTEYIDITNTQITIPARSRMIVGGEYIELSEQVTLTKDAGDQSGIVFYNIVTRQFGYSPTVIYTFSDGDYILFSVGYGNRYCSLSPLYYTVNGINILENYSRIASIAAFANVKINITNDEITIPAFIRIVYGRGETYRIPSGGITLSRNSNSQSEYVIFNSVNKTFTLVNEATISASDLQDGCYILFCVTNGLSGCSLSPSMYNINGKSQFADTDDVEELKGDVEELIDIDNWINGSLDQNLSYIYDDTRIIGTVPANEGVYGYLVNDGYKVSIRFLSDPQFVNPEDILNANVIYFSNAWLGGNGTVTAPSGTKSAIYILRKVNNGTISPAEGLNFKLAISHSELISNMQSEISGMQSKMDEMQSTIGDIVSGDGTYTGQKLSLGGRYPYKRNIWKTINIPKFAQSIAIHNNYIVFFYGDNVGASIWDLTTLTKLSDLTFDNGGFSTPHGNVMCFGNEYAAGNTILPLLYVSQWDGEGGCLVYNINTDGTNWTCTLVQSIMTSNMPQDIFGSRLGDWVVDKDNNCIWSIKYHLDSSITEGGNYDQLCKFNLPKLTEGSNIVLTEADIKDSFIIPFTKYGQDKIINDGIMYIAAGSTNNTAPRIIYAVDTIRHSLISKIDISDINNEPEGIEITDDGLILGYGYDYTKFYVITT